tara:strand:- start:8762 stop:13159 length:4398 start_codon:yes stop_codon:yes gene_type:complete
MFTQQGPGGVFHSAVAAEPEMHPLIEGALSLTPYAAGLVGASYMMHSAYGDANNKFTKYDIFQRQIRNLANKTPFGLGNTFRVPEFMSPYASPEALGLEKAKSSLDSADMYKYIFSADSLSTESTRNLVKGIIGESAYGDISTHFSTDSERFRLVYEQEADQRGRGRLVFEELEEFQADKLDTKGKKIGVETELRIKQGASKLLSEDVAVQNLRYSADLYDMLEELNISGKINPAYQGFVQNMDVRGVVFDDIFKGSDGSIERLGLIASAKGSFSSLEDLRRRTAYPTAYLSAGLNRFNRLIAATKEQMPILGKHLSAFGEATGLGLSTKPGPFYKQFFEIGYKASKIGAASVGLATIDHYRRNYGAGGNLVASAGTSMGFAYLYDKMSKGSPKVAPFKVGAAAMAVQMFAPGFDQGLIEGVATTAVNLDIGRSYLGQITGMSYLKRGIEGVLPGFTDPTTSLYLGLGATALSYFGYGEDYLRKASEGNLNTVDDLAGKIVPQFIKDRLGLVGDAQTGEVKAPLTKHQIRAASIYETVVPIKSGTGDFSDAFMKYNPLAKELSGLAPGSSEYDDYLSRIDDIIKGKGKGDLDSKEINKLTNFFNNNKDLFDRVGGIKDSSEVQKRILDFEYSVDAKMRSEIFDKTYNQNDLNRSLLDRIEIINKKYQKGSALDNILRRTEILGAEIYHSFFGASLKGDVTRMVDGEEVTKTYDQFAKSLNASPIFRRFGALFLGVAATHQVVTGGLFGTMENPDELKEIYSGKKLVEIKKGRWWEGGGTPLEGNETSYFRPHAYVSLMTQAKERAVWGDETDEYSPLTRFALKNFTYHLEEKNYYDRPYPITGSAFEDVPVIGGILSNTIGRLIKPPKLMHEEELYQVGSGGQATRTYLQEFGTSPELGQIGPGIPKSPKSISSLIGGMQYQFREIEGLTGYTKNYLQKLVTGRETVGTREFTMASSADMDSAILDYWDMDLGGMAFTSEPIRRLLPRPRSDIEKYNPIANSMPSWMPARYRRGDPYRSIPNGFARLPGKAYEALNPELKGLDPEDYPDIHKYKILSDLSPKSRETLRLRNQLMERKVAGLTTELENRILENASEAHRKRLASTRDFEYAKNAIKIPVVSDITRSMYQGAESIVRKVTAPVEYLIPGGFRPTQKLLGRTRSAIETYEQERVYGTTNAFWDKHVRDWFRPALYSAANLMGWDGKPVHVERREELDSHFDKLQFLKFMNLAQNAENGKDRQRYMKMAAQTRTGVNPNGDALGLYLSLPNAEKRFFDAFANAKEADRDKILELVPEDQVHLYQAVWNRIDSGEKLSLMGADPKANIDQNYMHNKLGEVQEYFKNRPLPGPDWIGWHKDVDIEDIKVKYIDNTGQETHDYDVWNSQVRRVSRRPFLEGADMFMYENPGPSRNSARNRIIRGVKNSSGIDFSKTLINTSHAPYENSRAEIYYNDDRGSEILSMLNLAVRG